MFICHSICKHPTEMFSNFLLVALKAPPARIHARDAAVLNGHSTAKQLLLWKFHHLFVNHKTLDVIRTLVCRSCVP